MYINHLEIIQKLIFKRLISMKKYIMTDSIVKSYPILYKKDKNGKERVWEIKAVYEKEQFLIDIKYGRQKYR